MSRPKSVIVRTETYQELSKEYYKYQKQLGYIEETCRTRQLYLNEFLSWLESRRELMISLVNDIEISKYHHYLKSRPSKQNGESLSEKYIVTILKSVAQFFEMLVKRKQLNQNPVSRLNLSYRKQDQERQILSQEEIESLYRVCETIEERAILSLAYGCGLRSGELENIDLEDVKIRSGIVIIKKGKGNKRRVIPLSKGVKEDLKKYEKERKKIKVNSQAFMLNTRNRRMREYSYNKRLKELVKRASITKYITIHHLRHSIASHLIEEGMGVEQVRDFLGHSQLETTQIYTHVSDHQIKRVVREHYKNE